MLSGLPDKARAFVCKHVVAGARPLRHVSFWDSPSLSCMEPDHDERGGDMIQLTMGEVRGRYLPAEALELAARHEMTLDKNGTWHEAVIVSGPRLMGNTTHLRLVQ